VIVSVDVITGRAVGTRVAAGPELAVGVAIVLEMGTTVGRDRVVGAGAFPLQALMAALAKRMAIHATTLI
jgi:hypothetical protein